MNKNYFPPNFSRPTYVALIATAIFCILPLLSGFHKREVGTPVALIGVHHLGPEYRINEFYVNKQAASSISEGGGGGGHVCCIKLPKKWRPGLQAEIRWNVHHNLTASNEASSSKSEAGGIYKALVPIEFYTEPSNLYIHFFTQGRVRIVVSRFNPIADQHPIGWADAKAEETATKGIAIDTMFTPEEIAAIEHSQENERSEHGDWR